GGHEVRADLLEVQRAGDGRREPEDRAELLILLALRGLRVGFRGPRTSQSGRQAMHDHGGDEADAEPDDEGHDLDGGEHVPVVPSSDDDPALGKLDRVDELDREENQSGIQRRRRHVEAQRARELTHSLLPSARIVLARLSGGHAWPPDPEWLRDHVAQSGFGVNRLPYTL